MDFGNSQTTRVTERIMERIREHLRREPPPQENHHYNRVYEAVHSEGRPAEGGQHGE